MGVVGDKEICCIQGHEFLVRSSRDKDNQMCECWEVTGTSHILYSFNLKSFNVCNPYICE